MATNWKHRRGVLYAFLTGLAPVPLMLFWGAGWAWSLGVSLPLAAGLALLYHRLPHFWYALADNPDPKHTERQEIARTAGRSGQRHR